ncbi:hypothetical protein [Anaerolinea thermophila]|uniref:Uncharacterized protein n=1 Tax=Anaerolinea thermophila (strain DSM 14523 / JCM 11388 / NBRC 100420 / UNI-1) TaxID=926569 RepID=E8N579_ANATU|nr:hypothetical protein [Anaerolinea thermophila]BAJ63593.1 hypothetical protein ANT_15650 [Anaerolinea thermophila UNI-1]
MSENQAQEKTGVSPIEVHGVEKRVIGDRVIIRQGVVQSLEANEVTIRQGATLISKATNISVSNSSVAISHSQEASFSSSKSGITIVNGNANFDQSGAKVLLVNGNASLDQSGNILLAAKEVQGTNINTVFFFGKNVHGNVQTAFGAKESILFGLIAGFVSGTFLVLYKLFFGKKQ